MKQKFLLLITFIGLLTTTGYSQTVFNGNTKSGFGGAVGNGNLSITDNATNIIFTFTKGTGGDFDNALVIYVDTKTGGFTSTASSTDNGDGLRMATSGYSSVTNKSVLTFPAGFVPDYAISFDIGFAAIFELIPGGANSLGYVGSGNLLPAGATKTTPVLTFTVPKASIGITNNSSMKFLASCISTTSFRSNEYIGEVGPAANSGFTDYTATAFNTYNFTVVLPISLQYFNGISNNEAIGLNWKTSSEVNANNFDIEKLTTSSNWVKIGTVAAANISGSTYTFTDNAVSNGSNTYRLNLVDKDGKKSYSNVISINASVASGLKLYPTLVNSNSINVVFNEQKAGKATIKITSLNGKVLQQNTFNVNEGSSVLQQTLPLLAKGNYVVTVNTAQVQKTFTIFVQ